MESNQKIIIVGAGLSGLTLAYELQKLNIEAHIIEGSDRIGGRIETKKGLFDTPLELGATWFSDLHKNMLSLIEELGIKKYPQFSDGISLFQTKSFEPPQMFHVPQSESPSYRLVDGSEILIQRLASSLSKDSITLNSKVTGVSQKSDGLELQFENGEKMEGDIAIICMPPQLIGSQISFVPKLPNTVVEILPMVQTWMASAIKFTLEYEEPFWRNSGYSGMLYSHVGIITEMYDHTNFEGNKFGFTGFLHSGSSTYSQEVRKELVLNQLEEIFKQKTPKPIAYYDKVWNGEFILNGNQIIQRPHQNNGHPIFKNPLMDGALFFGSTETSTIFPGYMEGAIARAKELADTIAKILNLED